MPERYQIQQSAILPSFFYVVRISRVRCLHDTRLMDDYGNLVVVDYWQLAIVTGN